MSNENDLKPCPFCGGEAYYTTIDDGDWECRCFDCGATVRQFGRGLTPESHKHNRKLIIKKWNRRNERLGEWIKTDPDVSDLFFECSECGKTTINRTCYCPYCGAKMEGETDE